MYFTFSITNHIICPLYDTREINDYDSSYILTPLLPQARITLAPAAVGCVNATSPFSGSSGQPCMNVCAAALSSFDATP